MTTEKEGEGGGVIVNLAITEELEDAVIRQRGFTSRVGIAQSVNTWLPVLVKNLVALGFRGGSLGRRKPRRLYRESWERLCAATERTGIAAPMLLRACMQSESNRLSKLKENADERGKE